MQNFQVAKGLLPSTVFVPASKSYANRALILASLMKSAVSLSNLPLATDVTQLLVALKSLGLQIEETNGTVKILNSFPECEMGGKTIGTGEGGTTARFLAALLLLGKQNYELILGKRLKERPWSEFLSAAKSLGARAELNDDVLCLCGPVRTVPSLDIDCSRTTQFATAFDLTLRSTKVYPNNLNASESYWKMNASMKSHFENHNSYTVPADWSSAAFPMVFAALNQKITFPGLERDDLQADSKIISVLDKLGALKETSGIISIVPFTRSADIFLDMKDCLDLFPAISFLLSHIEGQHFLSGLENLTHKESDRLAEVTKLLKIFGRSHEVNGNTLKISGSRNLAGPQQLSLPDDHRIVMTAALFLRHHSGGSINQATSVNKSYPKFFDLLR